MALPCCTRQLVAVLLLLLKDESGNFELSFTRLAFGTKYCFCHCIPSMQCSYYNSTQSYPNVNFNQTMQDIEEHPSFDHRVVLQVANANYVHNNNDTTVQWSTCSAFMSLHSKTWTKAEVQEKKIPWFLPQGNLKNLNQVKFSSAATMLWEGAMSSPPPLLHDRDSNTNMTVLHNHCNVLTTLFRNIKRK